jgi:predicted ABC-type sugar transport system permease subunit
MHHSGQHEIETLGVSTTRRDLGWTAVEVLLVVLILSALAVGVGFALRSMRPTSAVSNCGIGQPLDLNTTDGVTSASSSPC